MRPPRPVATVPLGRPPCGTRDHRDRTWSSRGAGGGAFICVTLQPAARQGPHKSQQGCLKFGGPAWWYCSAGATRQSGGPLYGGTAGLKVLLDRSRYPPWCREPFHCIELPERSALHLDPPRSAKIPPLGIARGECAEAVKGGCCLRKMRIVCRHKPRKPCNLLMNRVRSNRQGLNLAHGQWFPVRHAFSQFPQALVQADLGVDAAQRPH